MNDLDELLTANEAAALLKIHLKTLYKFANSGKVPGFRVGKLWRFSKMCVLNMAPVKLAQLLPSEYGSPYNGRAGK